MADPNKSNCKDTLKEIVKNEQAVQIANNDRNVMRRPDLHKRTSYLTKLALPAIKRCESNGIGFDTQAHQHLIDQWEAVVSKNTRKLQNFMGAHIKLSSSQQLAFYFSHHYRKEDWPVTKSGQYETRIETLQKHAVDFPLLSELVQYKQTSALLSYYGYKLRKHVREGRLYWKFNPYGCKTGRISSEEPNLQNIPRSSEVRQLFVPSQGHLYVIADYNQIELRVAALLSKDPQMISDYASGTDLHTQTARRLLNQSEVTPAERQLAKAINFGILFGMTANKLVLYAQSKFEVSISKVEAIRYIRSFYQAYPRLKQWQEELTHGRTENYNQMLNEPVQRGAAEVLLIALQKLHDAGWKILNIIHDEVIVEVLEQDGERVRQLVERLMQEAWEDQQEFVGCILPGSIVEARLTTSWAKN